MTEPLTPAQRRTRAARDALAGKFESPEQKSEHYRALARRSAEQRVTLRADEAAALRDAYALLRRIAERALPGPDDAPTAA